MRGRRDVGTKSLEGIDKMLRGLNLILYFMIIYIYAGWGVFVTGNGREKRKGGDGRWRRVQGGVAGGKCLPLGSKINRKSYGGYLAVNT